MTNTLSDVYLFSLVFTQFTYFPQDVSETYTSLHSTELQLILRYDNNLLHHAVTAWKANTFPYSSSSEMNASFLCYA